jgi:hypothetical protein
MATHGIVRPYRSGDEEGINTLFNRVFGLDRSLDQMHWEFMNGPVSLPEGSIVAEDKGRIVGFFGSLFLRIQMGNRIVRNAYGVDNANRISISRRFSRSSVSNVEKAGGTMGGSIYPPRFGISESW